MTNLTVKGQVTIPKDVRDALGLKPGEPVEIDWDGGDVATIRRPKRDQDAEMAVRKARLLEVASRFDHFRTGESTEAIMRDIRGGDPFPV